MTPDTAKEVLRDNWYFVLAPLVCLGAGALRPASTGGAAIADRASQERPRPCRRSHFRKEMCV